MPSRLLTSSFCAPLLALCFFCFALFGTVTLAYADAPTVPQTSTAPITSGVVPAPTTPSGSDSSTPTSSTVDDPRIDDLVNASNITNDLLVVVIALVSVLCGAAFLHHLWGVLARG